MGRVVMIPGCGRYAHRLFTWGFVQASRTRTSYVVLLPRPTNTVQFVIARSVMIQPKDLERSKGACLAPDCQTVAS